MIHNAVGVVAEKLNNFLKSNFGLTEDKVLISNFMNQDGSSAIIEPDKVVVTLVNLQEEKVSGNSQSVKLVLSLLFTANFSGKNYLEALKFLSATVSFFQSNTVFDSSNSPDLDSGIEKLRFEIDNLDFNQQSNLWGALGAKQMPAVLYKVRMINFRDSEISNSFPVFGGVKF